MCCGSGCIQATGERHQISSRGGLLRSPSAYHDSTTENQGRAFKVEYSTETVDFAENDIDMEYEQLMELEAKQRPGADGGVLRGTYIDLDSSYEVYSLASTLFMRECCKSL